MALPFETPYPANKHGRRIHVARLIATGGNAELVTFCRQQLDKIIRSKRNG